MVSSMQISHLLSHKHCHVHCSGYKYLGVFLHEFLSFDIHCEAIRNSAGRALGAVISKFSYFKKIGFKTFDKLFVSNVESVMSYGASSIGLKDFGFEQVQSMQGC